jgi:hypothetical protein
MKYKSVRFEDNRVGRHQPPLFALRGHEQFISVTVVFVLADNQSIEAARVDEDPSRSACLEP